MNASNTSVNGFAHVPGKRLNSLPTCFSLMKKVLLFVVMALLAQPLAGCIDFGKSGPVVAPTCPNGETCVCIDVDGSCSDGDDDWGYYVDGFEVYYCSNDDRDYAIDMGGIYCPDAGTERDDFSEFIPNGEPPVCPNGEACICIDVDDSCTDGDDDWGYVEDGQMVYYCSNDGRGYAQAMGGIYCPDAEPQEPACGSYPVLTLANNSTDLSGSDLSCMDLTGLDLSGFNLTSVVMHHALLTDVNLSGAVLEYADFTNAEFTGVVLTDVSIKDTLCPSGEEMLWNDELDGVCP